MIKAILFILIILSLPLQAPAQPEKKFLPDLATKMKARIRVTGTAQDTSARTAEVSSFNLKAGEIKAVAKTGIDMVLLRQSDLHLVKDTFRKARVFALPELYFARVEGTNEQISYRILFIDTAPLRYDFRKMAFEGTIRFLPIEAGATGNGQPEEKRLSAPEDIRITYGSNSIPVKIVQINWPPVDVSISSGDALDSVEVRILTIGNPAGYPKNLRVEPAILLTSSRSVMQGLGLQTIPLHIVLKGVSVYKPVPLSVEASRGTLESSVVTLTGDRPAEVVLRSENVGMIDLHVINPNFRSNSISIHAVFPWLFLCLAVFGGFLGGIARKLNAGEKISAGSLILACLFGLIAAFAYWGLGIKLIDFSFETRGLNEAMVFALGLIAGFFGIQPARKQPASTD